MTNELNVNAENFLGLLGLSPPPAITPDMPPAAASWIEQATAALVAAANMGDPKDYADAEKNHAERAALATDAATKFPANEQQQAGGMDQLAQQLPQMASGLVGAMSGAISGALQPLAQIPQQLAQTGQQLLQTGMGALQQTTNASSLSPADLAGEELGAFGGGGAGDIGGGGAGVGGGGGGIGTTPMAMLGPPATPSATTTPTAGRAIPPITAATTAHPPATMGGMGGMPMMPHGGAHGANSKDAKAETKRVSVPSLKNGAPVQGRITTPPPVPTVTKTTGDPKAAARRRIVIPSDKGTEKATDRPDGHNED
ncbi:MAG TPA: hypothetical protein VFW21_03220 [Mycobacterium sp.]|nr:hypothetical protein [Mycobacterium sp.]